MKMMKLILDLTLFIILVFHPAHGFPGVLPCSTNECRHRRGYIHFFTWFRQPYDGLDFRTINITKDYVTLFDITIVIKNMKNFDSNSTVIQISAQSKAEDFYFTNVKTSANRIFHFKNVKNVKLLLFSFKQNVVADLFYFMDCDFKMEQFSSLTYPERDSKPVPILKTLWGHLLNIDAVHRPRKSCWFVVPLDNYEGLANIKNTYIVFDNALNKNSKLDITDVITDKVVLTHSDKLSLGPGVTIVEGQDKAIEVGINKFPATTVLFVDYQCVSPLLDCSTDSKFHISFKPFTNFDIECIKVEEFCRFGRGESPFPTCRPEDRIIYKDRSISNCLALQDLLDSIAKQVIPPIYNHPISLLMLATGQKIPGLEPFPDLSTNFLLDREDQSDLKFRRMGSTGRCSNIHEYCRTIRMCSSQGSCARVCLMMHIQRGCPFFGRKMSN
uniref:uncharacterized protein LOC120346699 isoform X1 n=1 Tax=Styela clava TaxID=7725 RepID=UPI001939D075|nr:uncharacterized protein LOC120346699 isoform X1 [Styela clava]